MSSVTAVNQPADYVRSEPPAPPAKEKGEVEQLEVKKNAVEEFAKSKTDETKAPLADGTGRLVDFQA